MAPMEEKTALLEFENNPNIGLYMFANDHFALIGSNISKKKIKEIESILNVPVYQVTLLGTQLPGIFVAGNNSTIIVPEIYEKELNALKEITLKHGISLVSISERLNTFGNNLVVLDDLVIVNSEYPKQFIKTLEKKTGMKTVTFYHEEFNSPGAVCRSINNKLFISQEINEEEAKPFIDYVGGVGSVNSGGIYVSSGIVGNKYGVLIGSHSSSVEIQNILEGFNFL